LHSLLTFYTHIKNKHIGMDKFWTEKISCCKSADFYHKKVIQMLITYE